MFKNYSDSTGILKLFCTVLLHIQLQLSPTWDFIIADLPVSVPKNFVVLYDGWKTRLKPKLLFCSWCDQELMVAVGNFWRRIFQLGLTQSQWRCLITRTEMNVESIQYSHWLLGQNLFVLLKVTNRYQNAPLVAFTAARCMSFLIRQV